MVRKVISTPDGTLASLGSVLGGLIFDPSIKTASFSALANKGYFVGGVGTSIVTLPTSANDGDAIALFGPGDNSTGVLTFDLSGGRAVEIGGNSFGTTNIHVAKVGLACLLRWNSSVSRWSDAWGSQAAAGATITAPTANIVRVSGTAGIPTTVSFGLNSVMLRAAAGIVTQTIADGEVVGRPIGGVLGPVTAAQLLTILGIARGTYTQTNTPVTNVTSVSAGFSRYTKNGGVVNVTGRFGALVIAPNTLSKVRLSLPFPATGTLEGVAADIDHPDVSGSIELQSGMAQVNWITGASQGSMAYSFSYDA